MTTVEDRFNAAVNVIKSLPKNGSYQPSSAMMLTFYGYYKQATLGPCKQKKPSFWDVVGKAKWDAWTALGDMSRDRAMEYYVEELKKIIETMSYTENVANFMGSINELDNVNVDDLEAVAPEIMKKVRSQPNSPFASRESSPTRAPNLTNGYTNGFTNSDNGFLHQNGHTVEQSDDEYIDTVEDNVEIPSYRKSRSHTHYNTRSDSSFDTSRENLPAVSQQILKLVQKMNTDLNTVNQRVNLLEKYILEIKLIETKQQLRRKKPEWWPFEDISPAWFAFLIIWPFLAQRFGNLIQRKK